MKDDVHVHLDFMEINILMVSSIGILRQKKKKNISTNVLKVSKYYEEYSLNIIFIIIITLVLKFIQI